MQKISNNVGQLRAVKSINVLKNRKFLKNECVKNEKMTTTLDIANFVF